MKIISSIFLILGMVIGQVSFAIDTYKIDPVHSFVLFKVSHLGFSHSYGRIKDVAGQFMIDEAKPENSKVELVMKTASIDTDDQKRDDHLKGPDFFNTKQFPDIRFSSTSVKKMGNTYKVEGKFEMMGIEKPISFDFKRLKTGADPWGNTRTGGDLSIKIKRSDFKMTFMKEGIGDEVEVIASVEGILQK